MTELREILAADALTPSEVGAWLDPDSRWITVDAALLFIDRLTAPPTTACSSPDSDLAGARTAPRSRDEGGATSKAPEPPDAVTGVGGSRSGVTAPDPVRQPLLAAGSGHTPRPASPV